MKRREIGAYRNSSSLFKSCVVFLLLPDNDFLLESLAIFSKLLCKRVRHKIALIIKLIIRE